jgi:hypothetical protein
MVTTNIICSKSVACMCLSAFVGMVLYLVILSGSTGRNHILNSIQVTIIASKVNGTVTTNRW